jgi:hypothetical protein
VSGYDKKVQETVKLSADTVCDKVSFSDETVFAYADILNLPHHISKTHPRMSMYDRAAQFAPFAALTGHNERIKETEQNSLMRLDAEESGELYVEDC